MMENAFIMCSGNIEGIEDIKNEFRRLEKTMFTLSSIKVGMKYQYVRNEIIKSNNLVMRCLPVFCNNYVVAENLDTKEKVYVLRDYDTGIITDVTTDIINRSMLKQR